jgi:homoserine dehydrogenase
LYRRSDHLRQVSKIEGVFSGTLSYIFNEFSNGKADGPSFSSVVKIAREKGYTVRDPSLACSPAVPSCTVHRRSRTRATT